MTVPAIAIKSLRFHRDRFNRLLVTAQAVGLNDFLAPIACPNRYRDVAGCECINILSPLPAFFKVVGYCILVGKVTIDAFRDLFVRGVVPVFVLGIHHMAVRTGFGSTSTIGWRAAHQNEETESDYSRCNGNQKWKSGHSNPRK